MLDIEGEIRRLKARLGLVVSRAVVHIVNDSLKTQRFQLKILDDEPRDDIEHMQSYGVSFVPPNEGVEALVLAVGGKASHLVAICANEIGQRPRGNPPNTGGLYTKGEWRVFIDEEGVVHLGAQKGAQKVPGADNVDAELKRIWDVLTAASVVPVLPSGLDAGETGLTTQKQLASTAAAQRQSVALSKVRAS